MGTLEAEMNEERQEVETDEVKDETKQESVEEIQNIVLESIQPRLGEVFKRLGNEAFPSINNEEESIDDEHAKYFIQLCFESNEALNKLRNILLELDMKEACSCLEKIPKMPRETTKKEETIDIHVEEVKPVPYREVLNESFWTMVDCLQISTRMLNLLQDLSVLNIDMVSKIRCRPNRRDSVRTLLNFLLELGPKSLNGFILALRETDQKYLANILAVNDFA